MENNITHLLSVVDIFYRTAGRAQNIRVRVVFYFHFTFLFHISESNNLQGFDTLKVPDISG